MHRCGRERGRDRNPIRPCRTIREHQDILVGEHGLGRRVAGALDGALQPGRPFGRGPGDVDRLGAEGAVEHLRDRADLREIAVGQHGLGNFEPLVCAGLTAKQVRPRADHRNQRHHQLFTDRIDRRIGDLREILLEIIVEQARAARKHRDRRIGAHRSNRIVAELRHRFEEFADVFLRISEGLLPIEQRTFVVGERRHLLGIRQFFELILGRLEPVGIGCGARERGLDLVILDDSALFEIDQQHFAGLKPPLADDPLLGDRQHAGLGRHDDMIIVGNDEACRPKPVAVERRADLAAVSEGDGGRAVPWLHERGMIFVEGLALGRHQRVARPGFRDQHHHRVRQRIAPGNQQLQRVIEAGGVRLAMRDQRPHLVEIGAEQIRFHRAAARVHPVHIAAHRVDLAIMRDQAVGMRQLPGRKSVGGEALVDERDCRLGQRIAQILVKTPDLTREQQALVDDGARREGGHVEIAEAGEDVLLRHILERILHLLANHEQFAFEGVLIGRCRAPGDDCLTDHRQLGKNGRAQHAAVDRHVAPADQRLAFLGQQPFESAHREIARSFLAREETHRDGIVARFGQIDALFRGPRAEQRVGDLDQDSGSIAHQRIGTDRAAMIQVQ